MKSIEILNEEHQNILKLLKIMRQMCIDVLNGGNFNTKELTLASEFISGYGDGIHHSKEEEILFKSMLTNLGPLAEKLINTGMMIEHDLGRYYNMSLKKAIGVYDENPSSENALDIITYIMAYSDLLKRHIEKEDTAVFPFAERSLSADAKDIVEKQSDELDNNQIEDKEKFLRILDELSSRIK